MPADLEVQPPNPLLNPEAVIDAYEQDHIEPLGVHSTAEEVERVANGLGAVVSGLVEFHADNSAKIADTAMAAVLGYRGLIRRILDFEPDAETAADLDYEGARLGEGFLQNLSTGKKG